MKKLLITLLLAVQANAYEITLKFPSKYDAEKWVVWYLDGGGEQIADYYANDWNVQDFTRSCGTRPYLFLVREKEFLSGNTTTNGVRNEE